MTDREKLKVFFEKKSVSNKNKNYYFVGLSSPPGGVVDFALKII